MQPLCFDNCPEDLALVRPRNIAKRHGRCSDLVRNIIIIPPAVNPADAGWPVSPVHTESNADPLKTQRYFVSSVSSIPYVPSMSSNRPRRPSIFDRLVKVLKPTKPPLSPSSSSQSDVFMAVKAQRAPAPRIFSLQNKSERNIARKRSFAKSNASSASLGLVQSPAAAAQPWYIPNETTIFPLPAPHHPAFRSQPKTPATSSHGHERRPSLSPSARSHATSDLHTPNSPVASRPQLTLWIPESGTVRPGHEQKIPTGCRDGMYFDLPGGDGEDGEGPASAPVSSGDAVGRGAGCDEPNEGDRVTEPEKILGFLPLELRSSFWIQNEVAGIQDEEIKRLATLAFL